MNPDESVVALSGWGRSSHRRSLVRRPVSDEDVIRAVRAAARITVRGAGRSYGDAALPERATVLDMTAHNRVVSFDQLNGIIVVEAGALLRDIIDQTLPIGWLLPVLPGTERITVGGAIASDVHGKNHPGAGSFGQHVLGLSLLRSDGSVDDLSAAQNPDEFWATVGGMGLTGVILRAGIQLRRVETGWATQRRLRTRSMDETLEVLRSLAVRQELDPDLHVVAWLDTHSPGRRLGRAVVDECRPTRAAELPTAVPPYPERRGTRTGRTIRSLPGPGLVCGATIAAASTARWHLSRAREGLLPIGAALCPLDAAESWPAAFGRGGLIQYQLAVPANAEKVLTQVLAHLVARRLTPALSTIKNLGFGTAGPLSFPIHGWTLAVDLPARWLENRDALRTVDELVADAGGRVYLAKDAVVDPVLLRRMYSRLQSWQRTQLRLDPDRLLTSALAERLGLLA
ncbi:decaprenylphospho-beta-D-ribofuranose 2-oxidase [Kribbella sp. VKM Ac-2527]|uniref:Decaprenylphospho-beta-D-ribofuranose 2-oxidase n=1 Tax=Kribbella caucasensis TaxID=2512215 RepID=A0A4R6KKQ9_9ACTN|nr:FAD-binding oxidoreductase [Kribbella sp. VKM Ac-2527]TDO51763.1 decaprenylphospho-beta-D-ribofuranose 2-oxidase [Kribbella sp. VKM Ac-2527]